MYEALHLAWSRHMYLWACSCMCESYDWPFFLSLLSWGVFLSLVLSVVPRPEVSTLSLAGSRLVASILAVIKYSSICLYSLLLWPSLTACTCRYLILECASEVLKHNGVFRMVWVIVMLYCMSCLSTFHSATSNSRNESWFCYCLVYTVQADWCQTIALLSYFILSCLLPCTLDHTHYCTHYHVLHFLLNVINGYYNVALM